MHAWIFSPYLLRAADLMRITAEKFKVVANRWVRKRLLFPLLVLLAAALLLVSEITYSNTSTIVRGGIKLTDARFQSQRLLQLMTDAETAQFGFLVTGQDAYLVREAEVREDLPEVLAAVTSFFNAQGAQSAAGAQRVASITQSKLAQFDRVLQLASSGQLAAANALARGEPAHGAVGPLRQEIMLLLARAAVLQQQARSSIYAALLVNRIAVDSLTLVSLLSLFLLLKQLQRQDRARDSQALALQHEHMRLELEVKNRTLRLAELARHLQSVREDERAYLARELHDELGGLLTVSKLEIARARMKVAEPAQILFRLERINQHLNQGIALKRRIIEDLRPSALSDLGLVVALHNLCEDVRKGLDIPIVLSTTELQLSPEADLAVYRFVQEALTNIGKYASATRVEVSLKVLDGLAIAEVTDDGVGFDPQIERVGRHGLSGMQFRAESMGGTMRVKSAPGQGSTLRIEFPQTASVTMAGSIPG